MKNFLVYGNLFFIIRLYSVYKYLFKNLAMKIVITKENNDLFFGKLIWIDWIYAQGESMEQCVQNLLEVTEHVASFKKRFSNQSETLINLYKKSKQLNDLPFSRLEFAL